MGVKATFNVQRDVAIQIIIQKLFSCSNDDLATMLERFEESTFRNYDVRDVLLEDIDNSRTISSVSDF